MPKPKMPDLVIALGKDPEDADLEDEAEEEQEEGKGDDEGKLAAAQEIIDAVKAGDAQMLAEALDNHHAITDAEAESDEDKEELAEEMGMADGGEARPDGVVDNSQRNPPLKDQIRRSNMQAYLRAHREGPEEMSAKELDGAADHARRKGDEDSEQKFRDWANEKRPQHRADGGKIDKPSLSPMAQAEIETKANFLTKDLDTLSARKPSLENMDPDGELMSSAKKMAKGGRVEADDEVRDEENPDDTRKDGESSRDYDSRMQDAAARVANHNDALRGKSSHYSDGYKKGLRIHDEPGAEDDIEIADDMDWYLGAMAKDNAKTHGKGHPDFEEGYRRGAARAIEKRRKGRK